MMPTACRSASSPNAFNEPLLRCKPWAYPRFIEFVTKLPKTATGKIQRFKPRALESDR